MQELNKLRAALVGKDNSRLNDLAMMTGEHLQSKNHKIAPSCDSYFNAIYSMHCIICIVFNLLYSMHCILFIISYAFYLGILFDALY